MAIFKSPPASSLDDEHPVIANAAAVEIATSDSFFDFIYSPLKSSGIAVGQK
jgi:hypothetical protein